MSETKQQAAKLLREYDELRARLRIIEPQLSKAVNAYGREQGMWGLGRDAFRIQIETEQRIRREAGLEQVHG